MDNANSTDMDEKSADNNNLLENKKLSSSASQHKASTSMLTSSPPTQPAAKARKKKRKTSVGFRKAPQAPRRFKSPYILFSISKMAEYKSSLLKEKNVQVTSISRRIAQEWKTLSKEERQKWDEVALQDKMRYNAEKSLYTGPWQIPSKRSRKVGKSVISYKLLHSLSQNDLSLFIVVYFRILLHQSGHHLPFCSIVRQSVKFSRKSSPL